MRARPWLSRNGAALVALLAVGLPLLLAGPASAFTDARIQFFDYCEDANNPSWCTQPGLYAVPVAGGNPALVLGDGAGYGSQWSQDGTKMAYEEGHYTGSAPFRILNIDGIGVMNADGTTTTIVSDSNILTASSGVSISPDGSQVVYAEQSPERLFVANTTAPFNPHELSSTVCGGYPYWVSATVILFDACSGMGNDNASLAKINPTNPGAGATYVTVTDIGANAGSDNGIGNGPSATPDGNTYLFGPANIEGSNGIYSVPAAGGAPTLVESGQLISEASKGSNGHVVYYNQNVFHVYEGSTEIDAGDPNAEDFPTWAPPVGPGTISGTVVDANGKGLAGATITITPQAGGSPQQTTTLGDGSYSVQVTAGAYTIVPSGVPTGQPMNGSYAVTACAGTTIPNPATCRLTVGPGATATSSFSYDTGFRLSGHIMYADTQDPVQNATVTITGGGKTKTTLTNQSGDYGVNLDQGTYTVTPDPKLQPTAIASADCQASGGTCTVNLDQNRVANFTAKCQPTLDFHTSMVAIGCFAPVDLAAGTWKAIGKFRMDRVDYESGSDKASPIIFDDQNKTVDGNDVKMSLTAPGWGGGWAAFYIPGGLHLSFPFSDVRHVWALTTPWATPGNLIQKSVGFLSAPFGGSASFFGFPAHGPAVELDFSAGQTVLNIQLSWPPSNKAFLDPINGLWKVTTANGGQRTAYPLAWRAKITANNDVGVSTITGGFATSAAYSLDMANDKFVRTTGPPPAGAIELAKITVTWDLAKGVIDVQPLLVIHEPNAQAKEWVEGLAGFVGGKLLTIDTAFKWVVANNVFGTGLNIGVPALVHLGFQLNAINKLIPDTPGLFFQRIGADGGTDLNDPLGRFDLGGNVGFTWLPRFKTDYLWFNELMSLDASGQMDFGPFSFRGDVDLKEAGVSVLHGTLKLNGDGMDASGTSGFDLRQLLRGFPFPAAFSGSGQLVIPTTSSGVNEPANPFLAFLSGWRFALHGKVDLWKLHQTGDFLLNANGAGLCATIGNHVQGVYFDGQWHVGGCNGGPFGGAGSSGATSNTTSAGGESTDASAATVPTFKLGAHSHVSDVAIRGRGGVPAVRLAGPGGLSLEVPAGSQAATSGGVTMVLDSSDDSTYLLFARDRPGTYRLTPLPGSAAIRALQFSPLLPAPSVSARVESVGCERRLVWRLRPEPGQLVGFVEENGDGAHALVASDAARGSVAFTPEVGSNPVREIAAIVEQQGTPRATIVLARFRAPTGSDPVTGLRGRVSRGKLALRWRPVCAASYYSVAVAPGGQATALTVTRTRATVAVGRSKRIAVSVAAVGPTGQAGRPARITVR